MSTRRPDIVGFATGTTAAPFAARASSSTRAIFCEGDLLAAMQSQRVASANDSKAFVDMPLLSDASDVLHSWRLTCGATANPSKACLQTFLTTHFGAVGSDLERAVPSDWRAKPAFLARIKNATTRAFAARVHALWPNLGRKTAASVAAQPDRHTLEALPHLFVVPGGRFRESYYWDSLWIVKGLLVSEMLPTAQGMVENLVTQVERHGFVPNGNRIYYADRSQPPMLSEMVRVVADALEANGTDCRPFLAQVLPSLEVELGWWARNRSCASRGLNYHDAATATPRPESWREDAALAEAAKARGASSAAAAALLRAVAGAAETGWDFSSRWLDAAARAPPPTGAALLLALNTSEVLPVDLNSYLLRAELNVRSFHARVGNESGAAALGRAAQARFARMEGAMWSDELGCWRDAARGGARAEPRALPHIASASDFLPLWALRDAGDAELVGLNASRARSAVRALQASSLLGVGGVGSTALRTGQQWDWPNGWAPLQLMLVEALLESAPSMVGGESAPLGRSIGARWLASNIASFPPGAEGLFEKFDVTRVGSRGGGGEYSPQVGFGWTNGVALSMIAMGIEPASPPSRLRG